MNMNDQTLAKKENNHILHTLAIMNIFNPSQNLESEMTFIVNLGDLSSPQIITNLSIDVQICY